MRSEAEASLSRIMVVREGEAFFWAEKSGECLREMKKPPEGGLMLHGAGDGNRTRVTSLEGWSSTIELHPRLTR